MNRKEAIQLITKEIKNDIIISANGFMSRDLFEAHDKPTNFYMIGSMGLASSIGLGIALKKTRKRIHVFDGDGNLLMNLGSLTTIGYLKPKNFVHFVFDNSLHESTGGQPTVSNTIHLEKIAEISNYKIFQISKQKDVKDLFKKIKKISGPILVHIKIEQSGKTSTRVRHSPHQIKKRFMESVN